MILLVLQVVLSLGIITLVLLQKGAGASAGAAFGGGGGGGGGAGSVFGASGSANFLSKTTAIFALVFFLNSLALAYLAANREIQTESVIDQQLVQPASETTIVSPDSSDVPAPEGMVSPAMPETSTDADTDVDNMATEDDVPAPADE